MLIPKVEARALDLSELLAADVIAVAFAKSETGEFYFPSAPTLVKQIERRFDLALVDHLVFHSANGKAGEVYELPLNTLNTLNELNVPVQRLMLVGVGGSSVAEVRTAGAAIGRKVRGKPFSLYSLVAISRSTIRAHAIAMVLGCYQWNQKSGVKGSQTPQFILPDTHLAQIESANLLARTVWLARDLIHTPSNIKNPAWMAQQAKKLTKNPAFTLKVLAGAQLDKFGGLRAVGNSSPKPGPRFIEINYAPAGSKNWPHIVIVGKGITFDTGGISLKRPYESMIGMKSDMAGAAAVLAVLSAMPELAPKVRVTGLLCCAENALSGSAQRPSDLITHFGGTTVEVINTDAEGRLVLADGLAYADLQLNPDYLVDIATLTGSATLGLGRQYAAMYTRNETLAKKFSEYGQSSGDRVWRMPLVDDYRDALESNIADFNHTADARNYSAGSITAALFLEHFAGKRQWLHLDIAGPARSESDAGENPKGGTGFGVRLLLDWIAGF